ncbi:MAG: hypothetical protein DI535_03655 [Citrobacter freundii]|nr:MAG: hypothetical protein DI535_03655 [Citrobacter freundii]
MDISAELTVAIKLLAALGLGAFIGFDREKHGKDAGIRTYAAVAVGATIFTSVGAHLQDTAAASRIVANIVVGVGFLGAGMITRHGPQNTTSGLTTAATIWCTAAIGVAIGLNMFVIAGVGAVTLYFLLSLHHQKWYVKWKEQTRIGDAENAEQGDERSE